MATGESAHPGPSQPGRFRTTEQTGVSHAALRLSPSISYPSVLSEFSDTHRYAKYRLWCRDTGVTAADYREWLRINRSISEALLSPSAAPRVFKR